MRISDWSSDVCSSDLDRLGGDDAEALGHDRQHRWETSRATECCIDGLAALGCLDGRPAVMVEPTVGPRRHHGAVAADTAEQVLHAVLAPDPDRWHVELVAGRH